MDHEEKKLSLFLTLTLTLGGMTGLSISAGARHYVDGDAVSRQIAREGVVLLKNENGALPLKEGAAVAIFGEGQHQRFFEDSEFAEGEEVPGDLFRQQGYVAFGFGSQTSFGDGGKEAAIDPLEALELAEADGRISICREISDGYVQALESARSPQEYVPYKPTQEDLDKAAARADTAIVFISRWSGELFDSAPADWELRVDETDLLRQVSAAFDKVAVVLNVPSSFNADWAKDRMEGIHVDAVLYAAVPGMRGSLGVADVLLGDANPSGKLTDTWARELADYPGYDAWGEEDQPYTEDIFLGYRWFETFDPDYERVNYEFGFGLSYTDFEIRTKNFTEADGRISVDAVVTNTGGAAGKEVVQMYVRAPQGALGKAAKSLCAFEKTDLLAPGESQTLTLTAEMADLASFDDLGKTGHKGCFVLEAGDYVFLVGNSVKNVAEAGAATVKELTVTRTLSSLCPTNLEKRLLADGSYETLPVRESESNFEYAETPKENRAAGKKLFARKLSDVVFGKITMDEYLSQMSNRELASFLVSYPQTQVGGSDSVCFRYGVNRFSQSDGSQGLCYNGTTFPSVMNLAATWNRNLAEAFGLVVGAEVYKNNIGIWLAPAVNLHRCPLGGRSFEYYSEDPLLTGVLSSGVIRAAQSMGAPACVKHLVGNEREASKIWGDSQISERALREIYLKPFEMAVTGAGVHALMTSYNVLNGVPSSESVDLLRGIVRGEWGFKGYISTDWGNEKNQVREANATNNVHAPDSACDVNLLYEAIDNGELSRATLEENAAQLLYTTTRSLRYYKANGCLFGHSYENGVCAVCHRPDPANFKTLPARLAELLPEADISRKTTGLYKYASVSDFFGRSTESFCAGAMAFFKFFPNFFAQAFGGK